MVLFKNKVCKLLREDCNILELDRFQQIIFKLDIQVGSGLGWSVKQNYKRQVRR